MHAQRRDKYSVSSRSLKREIGSSVVGVDQRFNRRIILATGVARPLPPQPFFSLHDQIDG